MILYENNIDHKLKNLLRVLNSERKILEQEEKYEVCHDIKLISERISDFILGYIDIDDIVELLFDIIQSVGELQMYDEDETGNYAQYRVKDDVFVFQIEKKDKSILKRVELQWAEITAKK